MRTMLCALWAISLAAGCDSEVTPLGGGGSGGDGGTGAAGGNGGDGGAGGALDCQQYIDQQGPPVQQVPIQVRNGTASPIYLGVPKSTCSGPPLYRAETLSGDAVQTNRSTCEATCSELAQGSCDCAAECAQPAVTMIHPGGTAELSWTAIIYEAEAMPEACYADEICVQDTCISPSSPPASLTFFVDGYPDVADCTQAICDCDGGASGSCFVEGATLVGGAPIVASALWSQSDESIEIAFE